MGPGICLLSDHHHNDPVGWESYLLCGEGSKGQKVEITSPSSHSWLVGETALSKTGRPLSHFKIKVLESGSRGFACEWMPTASTPSKPGRAAFHRVTQAESPPRVREPCRSPSHLVIGDQPGNLQESAVATPRIHTTFTL